MSRPSAGMKITKKDGVTFQSNVEHVKFTIEELIHAANRDVGKYIAKETANEMANHFKPTYTRGKISLPRKQSFRKTYANKSIQYWARKKELDVQIGYKNYNFMVQGELGEYNYPKIGQLRNTVSKNIGMINKIQSQYLTALNNDNPSVPGGQDQGDGE